MFIFAVVGQFEALNINYTSHTLSVMTSDNGCDEAEGGLTLVKQPVRISSASPNRSAMSGSVGTMEAKTRRNRVASSMSILM